MARFFIALALLTTLLCAPIARAAAPDPLDDLIRLQVIARSDSKADQLEKLAVRDRVRAAAVEIVRGAKNSRQALARLVSSREALEQTAGAPVEIRDVDCPVRVYGHVIVPAGRYRTVRVILGEGRGRNWWCVLYPGLCGVDALDVKALEGDQPVVFYSEIMRWVQALKGDVA